VYFEKIYTFGSVAIIDIAPQGFEQLSPLHFSELL